MTDIDEDNYRIVPQSEIDLQMQLTDPKWGQDVPIELKEKLTEILGYYQDEETGESVPFEQKLWGLLSFYTRDMRLGNLSTVMGEPQYCRYYLDLAGDLLREGYINAFLTALSRVISVLELSQSRAGFLRKIFTTLRHEHFKEEIEPKRKNLFGGKKNEY